MGGFPFHNSPALFLAPADSGGGHYDPEQPRDWHGRWTSGGEGGGGGDDSGGPSDAGGSGTRFVRGRDGNLYDGEGRMVILIGGQDGIGDGFGGNDGAGLSGRNLLEPDAPVSLLPQASEPSLLESPSLGAPPSPSSLDPWQIRNMAAAIQERTNFSDVARHYGTPANDDPAGTEGEIRAVAAEISKTDPAHAEAFYRHMSGTLPQLFGTEPGTMRGPFNARVPAPTWTAVAIADRQEITPAMKEKYTDDHLADAQKVADRLKVPVENILGLSALEGGWGVNGRFSTEGKNFFGLHYSGNDPHASGYLVTSDGAVKVARP